MTYMLQRERIEDGAGNVVVDEVRPFRTMTHPAKHTNWTQTPPGEDGRAYGFACYCPWCGLIEYREWWEPVLNGPEYRRRTFPPWDCECRTDDGRILRP